MAREEIAAQAWSSIQDRAGNAQQATVSVKNLDGSPATHWSAATGGTSSTANLLADANGTPMLAGVKRFMEAGAYLLDVPALSIVDRRVSVVSGIDAATLASVESDVAVTKEAPLNIHHDEYASLAVGDDWTASFAAAKAALPASGGEILVPYRATGYESTAEISLGKGHHWRGVGGARNANVSTEPFASTQIRFTNNGRGFYVDSAVGSGWGLEGLLLLGDPALTSQDLLTIGSGTGTFAGIVRDVCCDQAGRDGVVLDFALNTLFERVVARGSGRHGWRFASQANANTFVRCRAELSEQWGVYYEGGKDNDLNMVIESNSQAVGTDYGGMRVTAASWGCVVNLSNCHFENNFGDGGTGVPLQVDYIDLGSPPHAGGATVINEHGTEYSDTNALVLNGGRLTSLGIRSVIQPVHAVIGANHEGAVFINPRRWGTGASVNGAGSFDLTDNSGKSILIGDGHDELKPGIKIGDDTVLYRDAAGHWRFGDGQRLRIDSTVTSPLFEVRRDAESNARFTVDRDGALSWGPGSGAADTVLSRDAAGSGLRLTTGDSLYLGSATGTNQFIQYFEQTSDPAAGAANTARVFAKDNGSGKTQLCVRFNTGAVQVIVTEP